MGYGGEEEGVENFWGGLVKRGSSLLVVTGRPLRRAGLRKLDT